MKFLNIVSKKIDSLTMYQAVTWSLMVIVTLAFILSFTDKIFFGPIEMIASLAIILISSFIFHKIFSFFFKAPANIQSTYITALILFLIFDPVSTPPGLLALVGLSFFSVATKYIISINNLHILNPAAIAAVLVSVFGLTYATWWVGNPYMLPLVLIFGLVVTYKIRRFDLVISGILSALAVSIISTSSVSYESIYNFFAAWPILFFTFFMLTEPLSTPGSRKQRVFYGALVGGLSSLSFSLGPVYSSPELALVIANILIFSVMLKGRVSAKLLSKKEIAKDTYEFSFEKPKFLKFKPGEYLEWTLPHKNPDSRGVSRYFTISSSPTEKDIKLALKIIEGGSSFKKRLSEMEIGERIYAASLSGDFLLPKKDSKKDIVFISGGIGVTPFRSMVKYLIDSSGGNNKNLSLKMFLCNKDKESIPYMDLWDHAGEEIGMDTIHVLNSKDGIENAEEGYLTLEMLEKYNVDKKDTLFYISGPTAMVNAYEDLLGKYGVERKNIITDYFPGLA